MAREEYEKEAHGDYQRLAGRMAVTAVLEGIDYAEVKMALDAKQEVDPAAGIIIVKLDRPVVVGECDQEYHFYAARVLPGTFVNPHVHLRGFEPYRFLFGGGEMNMGLVDTTATEVVWDEPKKVDFGDKIEIEQFEVHSFRNTGETFTDFIFACPLNHLLDCDQDHPEGDRLFTQKIG